MRTQRSSVSSSTTRHLATAITSCHRPSCRDHHPVTNIPSDKDRDLCEHTFPAGWPPCLFLSCVFESSCLHLTTILHPRRDHYLCNLPPSANHHSTPCAGDNQPARAYHHVASSRALAFSHSGAFISTTSQHACGTQPRAVAARPRDRPATPELPVARRAFTRCFTTRAKRATTSSPALEPDFKRCQKPTAARRAFSRSAAIPSQSLPTRRTIHTRTSATYPPGF